MKYNMYILLLCALTPTNSVQAASNLLFKTCKNVLSLFDILSLLNFLPGI